MRVIVRAHVGVYVGRRASWRPGVQKHTWAGVQCKCAGVRVYEGGCGRVRFPIGPPPGCSSSCL